MFALQFYRDRLSQYSYTTPGGKAGCTRSGVVTLLRRTARLMAHR
jgi:hypothetical protein